MRAFVLYMGLPRRSQSGANLWPLYQVREFKFLVQAQLASRPTKNDFLGEVIKSMRFFSQAKLGLAQSTPDGAQKCGGEESCVYDQPRPTNRASPLPRKGKGHSNLAALPRSRSLTQRNCPSVVELSSRNHLPPLRPFPYKAAQTLNR